MTNRLAIIGSGATSIYTLKYLLASPILLNLTVFESSNEIGKGMPYRKDTNAHYMLCNAFSREIPIVTGSLIEWLKNQPEYELNDWELSSHELSARAFYPRLLIGEFLADEFTKLCGKFKDKGHRVNVKIGERVMDIAIRSNGKIDVTTDLSKENYEFDQVVIASGHSWPSKPTIGKAALVSPWPYTVVTALKPGNIGILGSSLSAIDVVVALGNTHGTFTESNETVIWKPNKNSTNVKFTMLSKMGIMPEGDFYYPYPYVPLLIFSPEVVVGEVKKGVDGLLNRLFELLCKELDNSAPRYLDSLGKDARSIVGFLKAYFKSRQDLGGLTAVKTDFAKARQSMREKKTIEYRYVLLRAHENFDLALRSLDNHDWKLFSDCLAPIFSDSYAAVPHLSLARVIAMFNAGVLSLKATGEEAVFTQDARGGVHVKTETETLSYDVMIDARGQAAASVNDLPFPALVKNLDENSEPIKAPFKIKTRRSEAISIYCLALPQILERHPFSQGLANCDENGKIVAEEILKTFATQDVVDNSLLDS